MITKIETLKDLPLMTFHGYLIKAENDISVVGDKKAYMFISKSPKCIYLFIEMSENPEIV